MNFTSKPTSPSSGSYPSLLFLLIDTLSKLAVNVSPSYVIDNTPPALIKDLQSRKLTDYIKEQVDRSLWRSFQTQAVKQGMKLKGTEIRETEYISVRTTQKRGETQ